MSRRLERLTYAVCRRFRAELQIKGLLHLEAQELALLEQVWKEQGGPNESERIFL